MIASVRNARVLLLALSMGCSRGPQYAIKFTEVTKQAGLSYQGISYGAACGDVDNDGDCDIYVPRHFLKNTAGLLIYDSGSFIDVANYYFEEPTVDRSGDRHGAAFVDIDGDGDQDLAVATGAHLGTGEEPNKIFLNEDHRLRDAAESVGLAAPMLRGRQFLFVDLNGDQALDAVLAARRRPTPAMGHTTYVQEVDQMGAKFRPAPEFSNFTNIDGEFVQLGWLPELGNVLFVHGWPAHLYKVRDDGLEDVTNQVGLKDLNSVADATWADFDGDADLDLFCAVEFQQSDEAINENGVAEAELVSHAQEREIQITPRRGDEPLDLRAWGIQPAQILIAEGNLAAPSSTLVLNPEDSAGVGPPTEDRSLRVGFDASLKGWRIILSSQAWSRVALRTSFSHGVKSVKPVGFENSHNRLQSRLFFWENGRFVEQTQKSGIPRTAAASAAAADFDCDGDLDIHLVCSTRVRNLPDLLLENDGAGHFTVHKDGAGASGSRYGVGDTVSVLDYDRDGGPDLFVTNGQGDMPFCEDGPEQLFHNTGRRGHWLELDLAGQPPNRDAIGARVTVRAGGRKIFRFQDGGMHARAQNDRMLHFGLGAADAYDQISIVWPGGAEQTLGPGPADRVMKIEELPAEQ